MKATAPAPRSRVPALVLPLAFTIGLGAFGALPQLQANSRLIASFAGATAVLSAWWAALWIGAKGRELKLEIVLRPQHYLQAIAHFSIFVYWGFYWPPLKDAAALIAAQIVFAYAFDMLLAWSRRETYTLGFGPFPIIFSTNLFLRFRDDWFYLQFVMVAVGFLAKELIRWDKDGRRVHIFNPSSFPLALASLLLLVTHTTHLTWGEDIATQLFLPPQIFLFIFLVALPGQYLFGVTTMTLSAVLTTYGFGLAYFAATGTYFFIDDYIPIAVFLGMHLLFTDPSTSPRTQLGRIIFGVLYGSSVVALYSLLGRLGAPTFYDKLLQVPIMNLLVQAIDRVALSPALAWVDPARLWRSLPPIRRNLAYTSLWVVVFSAMSVAQGLGDHHPGHLVPFWQRACREGRRDGCKVLGFIENKYCADGSGWACNEVGVLMAEGRLDDKTHTAQAFARACALGLSAGCQNQGLLSTGTLRHADPRLEDLAVVLREGKGPLTDATTLDTYARACRQGWTSGCGSLGMAYLIGDHTPVDKVKALPLLEDACANGHAASCSNLGLMYKTGDGVTADSSKALGLLKKACDLGMTDACRWLTTEPGR